MPAWLVCRLSRVGLIALGWCLGLVSQIHAQPFIEVQTGNFPLILSAPHGGYLEPDSLADRTCSACVTVRDSRTQEWARHFSDAVFEATGRRPWVVINLLARTKLDANREIGEAADGDLHAAQAWADYHAAIEAASSAIEIQFGHGLLLDLHGHGHTVPRFELGYLLSGSRLREDEASLNARVGLTSIRHLLTRHGALLTEAIRGSMSFGEHLSRVGIPSTPSPQDLAPAASELFFSGGYITARHGSRDDGAIDAIQLEAHRPGLRDSDDNVAAMADLVAEATLVYMQDWYADALPTSVQDRQPTIPECLRSGATGLHLESTCQPDHVEIFDLLGRRVRLETITAGQSISIHDLARGVYVARSQRTGESLLFVR